MENEEKSAGNVTGKRAGKIGKCEGKLVANVREKRGKM